MSIVTRVDSRGRRRHHARVHIGGNKYVYGQTRDTKEEARTDEAKLVLQPRRRSAVRTVDALCEWFLEMYPRRPTRRPPYELPRASTVDTVTNALKPFRDRFGDQQVDRLNRDDLKDWLGKYPWAADPVTLMFREALDSELIAVYPFRGLIVRRNKGRRGLDAKAIPSIEEARLLADLALEEHPEFGPTLRGLILFLGYTCLRPGEAFALRHTDIDGQWIHVTRNRTKYGVDSPKNHKPRTVVLPTKAREALSEMPRRLNTELVFTTLRGQPLNVSTFGWYWRPLKARFLAKLPEQRAAQIDTKHLTPYVLRHTGATWMLEAPPHGLGLEPEDIAVQLGHEDGGKLVRTLYGHSDRDRALERIRRATSPAPVAELRSVKEAAENG